jgi:hypothetical protein
MLCAFSISPIGVGESVSEQVAEVVRESGLPNETNAMFTKAAQFSSPQAGLPLTASTGVALDPDSNAINVMLLRWCSVSHNERRGGHYACSRARRSS